MHDVYSPAAFVVLPPPKENETEAEYREANKRWIRKVAELADDAEPGTGVIYTRMLLD